MPGRQASLSVTVCPQRVSPVHNLYYEQVGNPQGVPVVFMCARSLSPSLPLSLSLSLALALALAPPASGHKALYLLQRLVHYA